MIDIIIVNYNSTKQLIECLGSIFSQSQSIPINIYVIDNCSNDNVEQVESLYPDVKLLINKHNKGFAAAINEGINISTSPYLVLLNPDTYIKNDFFSPILNYMEKEKDVGIVGPGILNRDGSVQGSARSFPSPLTAFFGRSTLISKLFPNNPLTLANILTHNGNNKIPVEVDWVSGACMIVRRKAIADTGLMDEKFYMYWEDADWCRRMKSKGWKVVYFPGTSLVHYVGASSSHKPLKSIFEFHKSSYMLFSKYAKWPLTLIKPIAFMGLAIRILIICFIKLFYLQLDAFKRIELKQSDKYSRAKNPKVKVLRIISRLNIGGPAVHVQLLTNGLNHNRFEPLLITGSISNQEGDMSYIFESIDKPVIRIPELQREIKLKNDLITVLKIFKTLCREKPDIVHTHTAKAGFSSRLPVFIYNIIFLKRIRLIHTFHGHVFEGYFSKATSNFFIFLERLLAQITDIIIAISSTQKEELVAKYHIAPSEKIKTIELGFDLTPFFNCSTIKGLFRNRFGIEDDTLLIGIVGRLVPIKNHKMFINAAKILLEDQSDIPVKFVIIGDGELGKELKEYCHKLGVDNHIIFCSWIKDVPSVYADLDILALTSINEGTPVSVIEAMASSVPVVSSDAGGVKDLLGIYDGGPALNGFSVCDRGIICKKNDEVGFVKALKFQIEENLSEREGRIIRARSFVEKKYSKERLIHDIERLYFELMANFQEM